MDEIHYWAEMQSELKNGFAEMGSALAKLIRAAEARNVPPLLEAVSLQVTPQRINRRGYTFAYLLVSEETLKALGTSLITLQMGTFVAQVQAGVGLVQLPLVEDGYISVPGLTGSWDALVYLTNEQAPSVTPLGSTTTSPLITELTGSLAPLTGGPFTLVYSASYSNFSASTTSYAYLDRSFIRHARSRTILIRNTMNIALAAAPSVYMSDSSILGGQSINYVDGGGDSIVFPVAPSSGNSWTWVAGRQGEGVGVPMDSAFISLPIGSVAPTSGTLYIYKEETI